MEPESIDDKGLTTSGQNGSNGGQKLSNTGQLLGLDASANVEERTGNGQLESIAGQDFSTKCPQKNGPR